MAYLFLAGAILAEVGATSVMKLSEGFTRPLPALASAVGYAIAFYLLAQALESIPTGVAYAIWSGAGIVLIASVAWVFHGQKLDAAALAGMVLIVVGVILMNI